VIHTQAKKCKSILIRYFIREQPPSNIMYDRRVIRGNTYASMVVPAAGAQDAKKKTPLLQKREVDVAQGAVLIKNAKYFRSQLGKNK